MAKKRYEEYFAKVVLEQCFPKRFIGLQVADKPDLRCGTKIGIEVTNCIPKRVAEAFNLWHKVRKQGDKTPPRIFERLKQLNEVQLDKKGLIWQQGTYTDSIEDSPIKDFFNAVEKKVERLNSGNAKYADMESYELFVNSFIYIPQNQISAVIKRLKTINNKPRKFDVIYLVTNEQKLLVFCMLNDIIQIKCLYTRLDRMAEEAKQIYLGVKDE